MSNPFTAAGAAPDKQSRFAALLVDRFFTGQWSNSSPLRDAAVPMLYSRFYQGNRYDTIRSGQNVEISPRLTIIRRPGVSVYNSATFPALKNFYSFRIFDPTTQTSQIKVIADSAATVYDATGPSTQTTLFTKLAGAGQTSFQSVGNTLYAADGVSAWKWVWEPAWQQNHTYQTKTTILDPNNNLQMVTSVAIGFIGGTLTVGIASNVATLNWTPSVGAFSWTADQLASLPGSTISFSGFVGASFLNGLSATVTTARNFAPVAPGHANASLTFSFTHADYGPTADNAGIVSGSAGSSTSTGVQPTWPTTIGSTVTDGFLVWTCRGPSVQNTGIIAPTSVPTVTNTLVPAGSAWVASTYYWPANNAIILDSNSNIQQLTTDGTTGTVPVWSSTPGVTTADGSAVWTCRGSGTRATTTAYALGAWIAVTVTKTYTVTTRVGSGRFGDVGTEVTTVTVTSLYFFVATAAGTSSATTTANVNWPSALGGLVTDGSVSWANAGYQVKRANTAATSPTSAVAGNIANSLLVTQVGSIVDNAGSGGGSGFTQNVTIAGKSGAATPTWATTGTPAAEATGLNTTETGGLRWTNAGPVGAANTGTWVYGYAFKNSVTGHISTMSPSSTPITLAAQSVISISGSGDQNYATDGVDTIVIYRSVQGFTTPFQLTTIPAPLAGAPWSYIDASPDPPNPTSILNQFISADTTGTNTPPPAGLTNLTFYLNRVFGSTGNFQYYSGVATQRVGVGPESWPGQNYAQMPELVTKSWASATGLLIFTSYGVFFSQGVDGNLNPNTPIQILEDIGLLSPNLFTVNGSIPVILSADSQMIALDPSSGVTRYSDPIADSANGMGGFSTSASYLAWHVNGLDSAFYLADGATGWFRLCPTATPESGFTWSPKANIVGGCGAIKSIETSPGVKNLLISGTGSGPILRRDLTVNTDNAVTYAANFIIGSIVLAQPQQCAEVESISTFALPIGSRPTVAVLGSEIAPSGGTPFETLTNSVPEPDFLNAATSIFSDRWYFLQGTVAQPIWLQHMQIKFSWLAEAAANELLSFSLYGCVHL